MYKFKIVTNALGGYVSHQITGSHYYVDNNSGTLTIFQSMSEVASFATGSWVSVIKETGE